MLSDRRDHLTFLKQEIDKRKIGGAGFYVGGTKRIELKLAEEKQIILGTYAMASEGMDIPSLNTILLATPKTDVEQSVGRIFRQKKEERTHIPLIIDVVDNGIACFKRQGYQRKRFYRKNGYQIQSIDHRTHQKKDVSKDRFSQCVFEKT